MNLAKPIKPRGRRARRDYTAQFKSQIVLACKQPGASIAAIAQAHDVNVNVLHRWVREHERLGWHSAPGFMPIEVQEQEMVAVSSAGRGEGCMDAQRLQPQSLQPQIHHEGSQYIAVVCRRGQTEVSIRWPVAAASNCAGWLKDWLT